VSKCSSHLLPLPPSPFPPTPPPSPLPLPTAPGLRHSRLYDITFLTPRGARSTAGTLLLGTERFAATVDSAEFELRGEGKVFLRCGGAREGALGDWGTGSEGRQAGDPGKVMSEGQRRRASTLATPARLSRRGRVGWFRPVPRVLGATLWPSLARSTLLFLEVGLRSHTPRGCAGSAW
jgi:hypothetical protein